MNVWPRQQGDSFRFDDTVLVEFKLWYFPEIAIEATRAQIEQKADMPWQWVPHVDVCTRVKWGTYLNSGKWQDLTPWEHAFFEEAILQHNNIVVYNYPYDRPNGLEWWEYEVNLTDLDNVTQTNLTLGTERRLWRYTERC